jgi:hypothetical protein
MAKRMYSEEKDEKKFETNLEWQTTLPSLIAKGIFDKSYAEKTPWVN